MGSSLTWGDEGVARAVTAVRRSESPEREDKFNSGKRSLCPVLRGDHPGHPPPSPASALDWRERRERLDGLDSTATTLAAQSL